MSGDIASALLPYTSHSIGCAIYQRSWASGEPPCSCGLDEVRSRVATPSQGLDAATVEREWSLPDLRDLHTDVQRIRDHDLGNRRMRDLLQTTMDTLVAADVEYAALATDPHQHGGKG